jgi:hypothetical protein
MAFTPLVSPAVTPIDPNLRFPDSAMPGEYFSPLTSPAIEAQNVHSRRRVQQQASASASSSLASPLEAPTHTQAAPSAARAASRKDNRKPSVSGRLSGRALRRSPLVKPHGRRKQAPLHITPAGPTELTEHNKVVFSPAAEGSPNFHGPSTSSDGSGQSSISPEPLSDALMPPPILPRSAGRSPTIIGKSQNSAISNEPATPATLMKLQNQESSPQISAPGSGRIFTPGKELMEDIMLPESAATTSGLPPLKIDTGRSVADDEATPTLSAKTPKLSANSTPRRSSRTESRSGHASKSRQSGSASHVSPAIRPKISPSIKPLMPSSSKFQLS